MNAEQRRRTSKLAGSRTGIVGGPEHAPAPDPDPPAPAQGEREGGDEVPPPPRTRSRRRKTTAGPVFDSDMVSFNCKMSRGLRRQVRRYAADHDVDVQDVVADALWAYLAARGIEVPDEDAR